MIVLLFSTLAFSSEPLQDLNVNIARNIITAFGYYHEKTDGKKTGLEAEVIARRDAVRRFSKHLEVCPEKFKPNWASSFKSTGSEVYPNNQLRIILTAPIKDFVKEPISSVNPFKVQDKLITFKIISKIENLTIFCRKSKLKIGTKEFDVLFAPSNTTSEPSLQKMELSFQNDSWSVKGEESLITALLNDFNQQKELILPVSL